MIAGMSQVLNQHRGGAGEPLVLLHGIGGSWRSWTPVLPALEQRFEVIALDLPGFGGSPPQPDRAASIDGQADAIERELDAAGFATAHLAGNSSGGWLALELARRERARTVAALSPAGMWNGLEDRYRYHLLRNAHYAAKFLRHHPAATATTPRRWLLNWWLFMAHPGRWSADEASASMHDLASVSYMEFLRWTRGRRVSGLPEIHCPVLIAWGSRDFLLPRRQAVRFIGALPAGVGEFKLLRGVGHVPMADDPELIATTITEFALGVGSADAAYKPNG